MKMKLCKFWKDYKILNNKGGHLIQLIYLVFFNWIYQTANRKKFLKVLKFKEKLHLQEI